ncbi:MAG TPA: hypothetical protein VN999_19865 [Thermoanaerobaculia bacterium]|nr:hypothetical protein [Thermoanaerobaculia bacterium]
MEQRVLAGLNPVCDGCLFRLEGTCDGAEGLQDIVPWPIPGRPDCTDPKIQTDYLVNLAQHRPEAVFSLPPVPELPPFIPVLETGLPKGLILPPGELYGVGLRTVVRRYGGLRTSSGARLRSLLRLPANARLCLSCSCDDRRIEKLWERHLELDTWRGLAALGFEFVTGMTFSVWTDNPRFTQRYNIERNFASIDFLAGLGVPVVPIFFCPRDADLRQVGRWLRDRPAVQVIGALAQFYKSDQQFADLLDYVARIRDTAGRAIRLLAIGCATREKIEELFQRFPDATVMTNKPVRKAISGHALNEDLSYSERFEEPKETLIPESLALFARICRQYRAGVNLLDLATLPPVRSAYPRQLLLPGFEPLRAGLPLPQSSRRRASDFSRAARPQ